MCNLLIFQIIVSDTSPPRGEWVHVLDVWLGVFICGDRCYYAPVNGGASSAVIHPQAKTIEKLHAPHSSASPSPSLFSSHKRSGWSEVSCCCLCLCGPLCIYACSAVGWMTWGWAYTGWGPWNSAKGMQWTAAAVFGRCSAFIMSSHVLHFLSVLMQICI